MKVFTSDNHHRHKRIVDFTDRGKETTSEDHDEWLVEIWNRDVSNQCEIWHLGDLSFATKYDDLAKFVSRLNGNINLIKGNHDKAEFLNRLKADGLINNWYDYKEIKIGDQPVVLFHFPILAWHRQGYGSLHLHGHCVDNRTEILTSQGWKHYGKFNIGDLVYSYNAQTNSTELTPIESIISTQYTGEVYINDGKSTNFRVTKGHTLVYWNNGKYHETPIEEVPKTTRTNLITAADADKTGLALTEDELRLYICIASDGSIKSETNLCRIRVKKKHKIDYIRQLLTKLQITTNEYVSNNYVSFNFYIPKSLTTWNFKGLDMKLRSANRHDCEIIIEAYCHADGHRQPNGVTIYSQKEQEIDLLQEMFVTSGFMASKYSRNHGFGQKNSTPIICHPKYAPIYTLSKSRC